jgi:signal transduction histidine kinase
MVHNQAWQRTARGALKQGFSPRHSLPDHTTKALRRALSQGQVPRAIVASELLSRSSDDDNNNNNNNNDDDCPVICSPIHDDKNKVQGVLVQIFLKTHSEGDGKQKHMSSSAELGQHHTSEESLDGNVHHEETALDRQPFFQKFAEMLPTGLAIIDSKAEPLFVNRQFHDLTAHRGPDSSFRMWPETIHPDDYDRVMSEYHNAFDKQTDLETEFRAFGDDQWRLFFMRPLGKNNLQQATLRNFGGYICALIDVSSIKNAELAQARAAKEAQERKQQQERFIDMISHEIRNPLSAILHCTEDIMEGLQNGQAKPHDIAVDDIVEAVRTISLCVDHQKNLVDDVLSFSKLDASMLSLAPRATRPKSQMADTLKIFQPELRKRKIEFSYHVETQYEDCQIDYVMADLVRISQVIVNLMTNAIKFTAKQESKKNINIKVAASIERPTSYPPDVVFFKTGDLELKADATGNPEWGDGAPLYIMVAIRDSGIGISEESQAKLFERFQQATPKTSADYGGSGLGLNIARKMCQLHGGEIGVHSAEGEGSTFGFFFRVRRSGEPEEAERLGSDELSAKLEQAGEKAGEEGSTKVADKHVPEDLKSISNENSGPGLGREPSKDRRQRTSDMADEMNKGNAESKLAGNRGQVSHSTAQDDQHQKDMEGRPANAGRSSERPSSTLEKRQSNQSDDDNKAAGVNGKSKGDEKNSSTDTKSDQRDGKSNSEDDRPRILYVEVRTTYGNRLALR